MVRAVAPRPRWCLTWPYQSVLQIDSAHQSKFCCLAVSELFRHAEEEALTRSILRREHADARATSELINRVEEVNDIEANRHWFRIVGEQKLARNPDIDLRIERFMVDIG